MRAGRGKEATAALGLGGFFVPAILIGGGRGVPMALERLLLLRVDNRWGADMAGRDACGGKAVKKGGRFLTDDIRMLGAR